MSLVSHMKNFLVCVELTNFRIFTQHIPIFFQKYKTEIANRGQRQLLFITLRFRQIQQYPIDQKHKFNQFEANLSMFGFLKVYPFENFNPMIWQSN